MTFRRAEEPLYEADVSFCQADKPLYEADVTFCRADKPLYEAEAYITLLRSHSASAIAA